MGVKRVLFVCTGNTCRSIMAQGLMESFLKRAGIDSVSVESAGVFAISGVSPTRETQSVLRQIGVECSTRRAQPVTAELVRDADLIFVMEQFQSDEVLRRFPETKGRTHLLKPYGLRPDELFGHSNIPDPIGKPLEVYEVCFAEIREAVERVAKSLGVPSA